MVRQQARPDRHNRGFFSISILLIHGALAALVLLTRPVWGLAGRRARAGRISPAAPAILTRLTAMPSCLKQNKP